LIAREAGLLLILAALLPAAWFETAWRDLADAPQTVYSQGVPHTTATGAPLDAYEVGRSFLPIGVYHALSGDWHGQTYDLQTIASAGFNTIHAWEGQSLTDVATAAQAAHLQVIFHNPEPADAARLRGHPALLSWYLDEEPGLRFPDAAQAKLRTTFAQRRAALRAADPDRPVHIVAAPPGRFATWDAWALLGDVVAFSVYPVRDAVPLRLTGPRALADTVARAVLRTQGVRPVWFVAQSFASPEYGWRMPTPREYRTMIYAAIVHGATGVIAFAYDSFVTRDGQVLGVAPVPRAGYGDIPDYDDRGDAPLTVDTNALAASRLLWRGVSTVNREIAALTPALLSPTANLPYRVSVRGLSDVATPVRTLLKRDADGYVLIAVNLGGSALDTRIDFDGEVRDLRHLFKDDTVEAAKAVGPRWVTRLEAFETQIFRFDITASGGVSAGPRS
jgi:hypothetical protein